MAQGKPIPTPGEDNHHREGCPDGQQDSRHDRLSLPSAILSALALVTALVFLAQASYASFAAVLQLPPCCSIENRATSRSDSALAVTRASPSLLGTGLSPRAADC
jgi:hypothetical protein